MIEQQYYTRERGGLFSQTDGYDTVAKSPQLKLDYIKKNLHPLCNYDIPSELQKTGEIDETKYPPNMVIMPGPSGELIVGQAVYKSKDFTGLRSTFFMHNFILSENEKRRYMKEPEKLFGITGFQTNFNVIEGRQLPTLAAIPYDGNNPYFLERERLFSKIGMSQETFHKLVYATFIAANSKKKIFIILDVAIEELGTMAKALLYHLYTALPWSVTEGLGICTYANKMEAKKNIQITFLDKNTIHSDSKAVKDFIFDGVNRKVLNLEGDIESEPYIKTALNYTKNKMAWEKINHWADALSITLKDKSERSIGYYGRVCVLLELSLCLKAGRSYDLTGSKVRKDLMSEILGYLKSNVADDVRKELFDIMEYVIGILQDEIGIGKLIDRDELKALLNFKLSFCTNREQETHCIQILLYLLSVASRDKNYNYINELLEEVHYYKQTYLLLIESICANEELKKQVVYRMINEAFKDVTVLEELIEQMAKFEEIEFILVKDRYYTQVVYEKFGGCLRNIKELIPFLNHLQRWCEIHKGTLYDNLLEEGEYYFLEHLQLKEMGSEAMLCQLRFSRSYPLDNYEVIRDYQTLKNDLSCMSPNKIRINNKVQELIKIFYKQKVNKNDFYMLVYAFLEMDRGTYALKLNLRRVLNYLNDIQTEIMLDFIIWSKGQEMYIDKTKFDSQVVNFFVALKQKEGKVPKEAIEEKLGGQAKTRALSEKILRAVKPAFAKWLNTHGKLAVSMCVIIVVAVGSLVGAFYYQKEKQEKAEETLKGQNVDLETIAKLMPNFSDDKEDMKRFIEIRLEYHIIVNAQSATDEGSHRDSKLVAEGEPSGAHKEGQLVEE